MYDTITNSYTKKDKMDPREFKRAKALREDGLRREGLVTMKFLERLVEILSENDPEFKQQ
jgi:hypothetical protein